MIRIDSRPFTAQVFDVRFSAATNPLRVPRFAG